MLGFDGFREKHNDISPEERCLIGYMRFVNGSIIQYSQDLI